MNQDLAHQNIEDILDEALVRLQSGQTIESMLVEYSAQAEELRPLLEVSRIGLTMPVNIAPRPVRQRRFAEQKLSFWQTPILSWARFAIIPLSLFMLVLGGRSFIYAMEASLPSDNLYPLKRTAEKLQVSITRDSNKQASLQLELTQKRLQELKLASVNNNPEQEAAALEELKSQAEKTFATVPQIAAAEALATENTQMLDSLLKINKEQKDLVSAMTEDPQTETRDLASTTLEDAKKNGENLAALIATVQEQVLVDLEGKVSLTGESTLTVDKKKITVERTTFAIDESTVVLSTEGETATLDDIQSKDVVNVVGNKNENDVLMAKIISLVETEIPVAIEPEPVAPVNKPVSPKPATPSPVNESDPESIPEPTTNPNEVHGGFIAEPANQY